MLSAREFDSERRRPRMRGKRVRLQSGARVRRESRPRASTLEAPCWTMFLVDGFGSGAGADFGRPPGSLWPSMWLGGWHDPRPATAVERPVSSSCDLLMCHLLAPAHGGCHPSLLCRPGSICLRQIRAQSRPRRSMRPPAAKEGAVKRGFVRTRPPVAGTQNVAELQARFFGR